MKIDGTETFVPPATRVQIIRHKLEIVEAAMGRLDDCPEAELEAIHFKVGRASADIVEHVAQLDRADHLKDFQELLMAESAGTR